MNNYIPFMKFKEKELSALSYLGDEVKAKITPFFDIPRDDKIDEIHFKGKIEKNIKKLKKFCPDLSTFYLDNSDISQPNTIDGKDNYEYLISMFSDFSFIPVISIDSTKGQLASIETAKKENIISSDTIALRLFKEDVEDFEVVFDDFEEFLLDIINLFSSVHIIIDYKVISPSLIINTPEQIKNTINILSDFISIDRVIIAGSSIPVSISEKVKVNTVTIIDRFEIDIFKLCNKITNHEFYLGDYTVVSPDYSDTTIREDLIQSLSTARIIYTHNTKHTVFRGNSLKQHPRGYKQYNDLAKNLIAMPIYHGNKFSYGDSYIYDLGTNELKGTSMSAILTPTINVHITHMLTQTI